jgi:hypothetical protein
MADLMVGCPDGRQSWVDVKGMASKSSWWVKRKPTMTELYYVLVFIGTERAQDRFFIATQAEYSEAITPHMDSHPNATVDDLTFKESLKFENRWGILPTVSAIRAQGQAF